MLDVIAKVLQKKFNILIGAGCDRIVLVPRKFKTPGDNNLQ